jgi:DNA gyrase subunit B
VLEEYLEKNPNDAKEILGSCILAAKARQAAKAAKDTVLRKGALEGLTLPGKLADCQTKKSEEAEMFIVEGETAGGSAKQGRDRRFQAILPLRGKILNVEKAQIHRMLANNEIKSLIVALGTAFGEDFNLEKLRYGKVIIMTDADVDGAHIRTLLLTLFYRYFPQLIETGHIFIAQPPLYKVQKGKEFHYCYTDAEKDDLIKKMGETAVVSRYKGLGEMNPEQLWETTMDPETRLMKVVMVNDAKEADHLFDIFMGSEVEPRKRYIQIHGASVKNLDI